MPAIQLIGRYRPHLIIAVAVFLAAFVAELLYLRQHGSLQLSRFAQAVAFLPPLGIWLSFLPLLYLSWFGPKAPPGFRRARLIFFWAITVASVFVWINIFWLSLGFKQ